MAGKVFGIRGVDEKVKELFYAFAEKHELTPAEALAALIKASQQPVNLVDTDNLQATVQQLTDENTRLQADNTALTERIQASTEGTEALTVQLLNANSKADIAEARRAETAEQLAAARPTGYQFVFDPPPELAKQMQRAIAFDVKRQRVQRAAPAVLLQNFTAKALRYLLVNDYDHILK